MKRYTTWYMHEADNGYYVTYDDAIALARKVARKVAAQANLIAFNGYQPNIDAIIAQALEDPEPPTS